MRAQSIHQIVLNTTILNLIAELDEFKGRWAATQILTPERLAALRQVATIESVGSSTRIEGVRLTNREVEELLRGVKTYSFRSRDEQEVAGYAELMDLVFASHSNMPFTENTVKQLHSVLLKYSVKDERHRGDYKKFKNSVEAFDSQGKSQGIIFEPATPFDTPALMTELVEWVVMQIKRQELHSLLIIAQFVLVFLHIHPFQDGNGRLSRVLTTLLLLQLGYTYVPFSSFERVVEENKEAYYLALRHGQAELEGEKNHGMTDWFEFFLKSMKKQKLFLEAKLVDELAMAHLPRLSGQILALIQSRGLTSIAEMTSALGANRNTVKVHVKALVVRKVLVSEGAGRGVCYRLKAGHP